MIKGQILLVEIELTKDMEEIHMSDIGRSIYSRKELGECFLINKLFFQNIEEIKAELIKGMKEHLDQLL